MASGFNDFKDTATAYWNERQPRERAMLAAGAAAILLAIVYLLFLNPALSGRDQLRKSLPQMRQQAAELQGMARQVAELGAAGATPVAPVTRESLEGSLARRNLKAQSVVVGGDMIRIQLQGVSYAAVVGWLDEMQRSARVSLTEGSFEAQAALDTVNASLTLRQQKGEGG